MDRTERIARRMDKQLGIASDYPAAIAPSPYPDVDPAALPTQGSHAQALADGHLTPDRIATQLAWRDARIAELEAALAAKREADRFGVQVNTYVESCGTSYHVAMVRPDRDPKAKAWDPGTWSFSQHSNPEHAEIEAEELRLFLDLGVPLTDL